jgi:hypothetical protein
MLALSSLPAFASPTSNAPAISTPARSFGLTAVMQATSSLHRFDDPAHNGLLEYVVDPSIKLGSDLKLTGRLILDQSLTGNRETLLQNGSLTLRHSGAQLTSFIRLSPAVGVGLPLSKRAFRQESLILGTNAGARMILDGGKTGFTAMIDVTGSRSIHQFETATTGQSNTSWGISNRFLVEYAFFRKLALSADFVRTARVTYAGHFVNQFDFTQELSYQAWPLLAFAIGHNNSGATLKANQLDSNVAIFNENSSAVYASVTLTN